MYETIQTWTKNCLIFLKLSEKLLSVTKLLIIATLEVTCYKMETYVVEDVSNTPQSDLSARKH